MERGKSHRLVAVQLHDFLQEAVERQMAQPLKLKEGGGKIPVAITVAIGHRRAPAGSPVDGRRFFSTALRRAKIGGINF